MPRPEVDAQARRTRSGRLKMLLVLLACASPVIASYFTYFVIRPEGRNNYAALVEPPHPLPALALRTLDGRTVPADTLKGQWLLVVAGSGDCDAECQKLLYLQRQLREMTGRERVRIDKLWLLTDDRAPAPALQQAVLDAGAAQILRADAAQLAQWLQPAPGESLGAHLYIVDPMGNWMMRAPTRPDPSKLKRDLERLLRASASWDREGR
nr:hypothetical protein [Azohydromonas aeria]